jgi:hypothetical protein
VRTVNDTPRGTPRRKFLAWSGTALGGAAIAGAFGPAGDNPQLLDAPGIETEPTADIFGWPVILRRPQDQLLVTLRGYNVYLDYNAGSPPVLTQFSNVLPSYLAIEFGTPDAPAPMHVAEQAFTLSDGDLPSQPSAPIPPSGTHAVNAPPVGSRMAGLSRIAYLLPASKLAPTATTPLTLSKDDMLNWIELILSVVPNAVPPFGLLNPPGGIGAPRAPGLAETAIELPYNLIISPPARLTSLIDIDPRVATVFTNAINPVKHNGWTELWHTRLAARVFINVGEFGVLGVDETNRDLRTVRAIWCLDQDFPTDLANNASDNNISNDTDPAFKEKALRYLDRYDIVRLSGDFTPSSQGGPYLRQPSGTSQKPNTPFIPSPAKVDRLMLTSLGAWLEGDAHWDLAHATGKFNTSLLSWRQRTVQARDSYVRIVRKGYLFPWGHKAALVTVTEREFTEASNSVGAYLRQKTFIVVTEPVKTYPDNPLIRHEGRKIPFTSVELLTLVTPNLDQPTHYLDTFLQPQSQAELIFQPKLGGSAFKFHARGTDWAGDPIDLHTPVLWVDDTISYNDTADVQKLYNGASGHDGIYARWRKAYPSISLKGQRVSMAEPKDVRVTVGDTQLVVASFELDVESPTGTSQDLINASQPNFFPALHQAQVELPEAATVSGNSVGSSTMRFETSFYLANGFTNNKGGVFLETVGTANKIKFKSDKGGGSLTPNLAINGFSRTLGPASGDLADLIGGSFHPEKVFSSVDAKLLGGISLHTILSTVQFDEDTNTAQTLQLISVEKFNPHRIVTTVDWHPPIVEGPSSGVVQNIFEPTGDAQNSMDLHAVIITNLVDPSKSTATITGEIRDFTLHLFGDSGAQHFIDIPFDSLQFRSEAGKKTHVDVDVSDSGVAFQGALEFVQDLADALNFAGSGLTVDTAGDAITATLTLAIPTIAVGVFSLQNLAFNADVAIPYNGDPVRFDFAFCSRENPFQLTIMIFTGGGFVGLGVGADGVEMLEFSFDFGLGFDIDIGIASGQVSLTGGVYFELEKTDNGSQSIDLTAWVKASGGISALGLISISVELYLALEYQNDGQGHDQLSGDAEMSISVHIIFFGFSVGFSVHEEFAGSSTPPSAPTVPASGPNKALTGASTTAVAGPLDLPATTMITSMSADDWATYCASFALVGA